MAVSGNLDSRPEPRCKSLSLNGLSVARAGNQAAREIRDPLSLERLHRHHRRARHIQRAAFTVTLASRAMPAKKLESPGFSPRLLTVYSVGHLWFAGLRDKQQRAASPVVDH